MCENLASLHNGILSEAWNVRVARDEGRRKKRNTSNYPVM